MKPHLPMLVTMLSTAAVRAADTIPQTRLTIEGAQKIAAGAMSFARTHGTPGGSIAIVDEGGHLLHFVRLDGTFAGSANVAMGKARTSALFRKPTKDFEEIINKGRFTMTALPDFTPLQGGVPIVLEGQVIGAIGVSGARSAQEDEELAKAGAAAIAPMKTATR